MHEQQPFRIYRSPELENSSLVVGWSEDAGKLGSTVINYLIERLETEEYCEIEPSDFFPLGGVAVENDIAQFPEGKFYSCQKKNLVILKSNTPRSEWYKFLNAILDVAQYHSHVKEIFTVGAMVFLGAHTAPRELLALANMPAMKTTLEQYNLAREIDYESPPGHHPTLNSYLLWVAKRRMLAAASLWVPIPFYLVSTEDPLSWKKILQFLDTKFELALDLSDIDKAVAAHDEKIAQLRSCSPQVNSHLEKLESNLALTQEESEELVREVEVSLKQRN